MKGIRILALALGAAVFVGVAHAGTIQSGFGNTFVVTDDSGATIRYWLEPDGSYTLVMADGTRTQGVYEVSGDQLCMTPNGGERTCAPYAEDKAVGDSWPSTMPNGAPVRVTLQAGRLR